MVSDKKSARPPSGSDVLVFDVERTRSTLLWDRYAAGAKTLPLFRESGRELDHMLLSTKV